MNSRRVLIVEDDEGLRQLIKRTLGKKGFQAEGAATGMEAVERVMDEPSLVLLLDQKLPDMAGTEIITQLSERGRHVPFIVMTGQGDEKLAVEMMKLGASDYLVKSMDLLDLLPVVLDRLFRERETSQRLEAAEKTLSDREAQLLQAQKLESVGRLAGGVAHDFNNMLGVILGHTELALVKLEADHPVVEDLIEVRKAAERSTDLTRQLLAYARKQPITPKVLDVNETVTGMLRMLDRLMGEEVNLIWQPAEGLWPVCMDPSQIDQIMTNLCINARDAMAGHGHITIKTEFVRQGDDFSILHRGVKPNDYALLSVCDEGSGMDELTMDRLFEPFFTTKAVGQGTGLGLAMVYGIVRQNEGFITVDSLIGRGSCFHIYLPRYRGSEKPAAEEDAPGFIRPGSETVLVVEDEIAILEMIKVMMEAFGYRVLTAKTPGEAIRQAQSFQGDIHLLMTDVIMPEMNGRDLAREILCVFPNIRRVFMSGYSADVIAHHGVLDEGVFFLQKPFTMKMLATKIREALDK